MDYVSAQETGLGVRSLQHPGSILQYLSDYVIVIVNCSVDFIFLSLRSHLIRVLWYGHLERARQIVV